jgi:hypothetical protein
MGPGVSQAYGGLIKPPEDFIYRPGEFGNWPEQFGL